MRRETVVLGIGMVEAPRVCGVCGGETLDVFSVGVSRRDRGLTTEEQLIGGCSVCHELSTEYNDATGYFPTQEELAEQSATQRTRSR